VNACEHSLLACGECRPKERMPTIQELEAKIEQFKAELAAVRPTNGHSGPQAPAAAPLKLDLGCSNHKVAGFVGVDVNKVDGVDVVCDLGKDPWPWADSSVDETNCSHTLEHIPARQRIHFFNELYRVLKPGAKAVFVTPHWASCRAYGDVTHEWPPVSEMFWAYLDKTWRDANVCHIPFVCDFTAGYGYSTAAWLHGRNPEFVQDALTRWKEAAQDMMCTLVARK